MTEDKTTQSQLSPVVAEHSLVIPYPRAHPADGGSAASGMRHKLGRTPPENENNYIYL